VSFLELTVYQKSKNYFKERIGWELLWSAQSDPCFNKEQLVELIEAYDFFAVVRKTTYDNGNQAQHTNLSISYATLISGVEKVEFISPPKKAKSFN
jgi:hypothetical protein